MFGLDMTKIGEMTGQVENFFIKVTSALATISNRQIEQQKQLDRIELQLERITQTTKDRVGVEDENIF